MKKTFKEIRLFNMLASKILKENQNTKLAYALKKVMTQTDDIIKGYHVEISRLWDSTVGATQLREALEDKETGEVLMAPKDSERAYRFNKEGLQRVIESERDYVSKVAEMLKDYDLKEFDINEYKIDMPADITDEEKEALSGFII